MEDTLLWSDFVELLALESIDAKPASPFGDSAEGALFDALQGR